MKRGTKMAIFIASMGLTIGSLMALVGPRHCGNSFYNHGVCAGHNGNSGASCLNNSEGTSDVSTK